MKKVNLNVILIFIGFIFLIEAVSNIICIPVALGYSEKVIPFIWSALCTAVPGLLLIRLVPRSYKEEFTNKEGYLVVILTWLVLIFTGTLPYLFSNTTAGITDALFESASGFTTTGSTIFPSVEQLPHSILFWRSLTHWIGGFSVLVMLVSIMPVLQIGGHSLYSNDITINEKLMLKTKSVVNTIVLIYFILTLAEIISLIAGGMKVFDSICISFGTVSTGGFAIKNDSLASYSPNLQNIVTLFMFLSATSYVVFLFLIRGDFRRVKSNNEFWLYTLVTGLSVAFVTALLFTRTSFDFSDSLRHASFQVISQISTTGFATTDYTSWPGSAYFFMFLLMFAGGCTISTSGGIKMARLLLIQKNMKVLMVKLQHPNSVIHIKLNGRIIPDVISNTVILFLFLYLILMLAGTIVLIMAGVPVNEALGGAATAMANIGPGLGASGNMGNFSAFNNAAKITMSVLMIAGRVELFTLFAVFTKTFWKR
ncbi:MAG TPA: TrkH family potassium uptake protein [Bacteroidales bacterium]|nr:TrkH family potassium uptake protein [Bacteroidales bacterium]HPT11546.1 TrkH family potassium uptake protein [Bacteroidales bacterium]